MLILVGCGPPVLTVKFAVAMWVSENINQNYTYPTNMYLTYLLNVTKSRFFGSRSKKT